MPPWWFLQPRIFSVRDHRHLASSAREVGARTIFTIFSINMAQVDLITWISDNQNIFGYRTSATKTPLIVSWSWSHILCSLADAPEHFMCSNSTKTYSRYQIQRRYWVRMLKHPTRSMVQHKHTHVVNSLSRAVAVRCVCWLCVHLGNSIVGHHTP